MGKNEAHDYRGFEIEPCDGPESGHWRLTYWDTPGGECAGQSDRHRFDTLREAREYIDTMHEEGEREGLQIEREALEEFDRALYRSGSREKALREAGDMHGFDMDEMAILLEEREQPGSRPRRSKPMWWYPLASKPSEPLGALT